jgi:hypothetical protein
MAVSGLENRARVTPDGSIPLSSALKGDTMRGDYLIAKSLGEVDYDNHPDDYVPAPVPEYEIVVVYGKGSLRGKREVIEEGTLEEVKEWLPDCRMIYPDDRVYYRRKPS